MIEINVEKTREKIIIIVQLRSSESMIFAAAQLIDAW